MHLMFASCCLHSFKDTAGLRHLRGRYVIHVIGPFSTFCTSHGSTAAQPKAAAQAVQLTYKQEMMD